MYIVMDIGCIECGTETNLVRVYNDKDKAEAAVKKLYSKLGSCYDHTQHSFEVFDTHEALAEFYSKIVGD